MSSPSFFLGYSSPQSLPETRDEPSPPSSLAAAPDEPGSPSLRSQLIARFAQYVGVVRDVDELVNDLIVVFQREGREGDEDASWWQEYLERTEAALILGRRDADRLVTSALLGKVLADGKGGREPRLAKDVSNEVPAGGRNGPGVPTVEEELIKASSDGSNPTSPAAPSSDPLGRAPNDSWPRMLWKLWWRRR